MYEKVISGKDKTVKLDNLLTILNVKNLEIDKVKVNIVKDGVEDVVAKYGQPQVNELFVLEFKDVDDINSFKVKGKIEMSEVSFTADFVNNTFTIKTDNESVEKSLLKIADKI